jgi:zinc/manganese transport system permease protein
VFSLLVMPAAAAQQITARPAVSFTITIILALVITWLSLGVAYFSVYPVGFYVSTFGFSAYVVAATGRMAVNRFHARLPGDAPMSHHVTVSGR